VKVKLDENLGHTAADLFRQAGHDLETVRSEGLSGRPDEDVIAACQPEQRCLVTLDLDFSNPLLFKPWEYAGIAVLRLPAKPSQADLLLACRTLLRGLEQDAIGGKLWSVQRGRIREYRPDRPEEESEPK
jgi:predicted nuclease of predicted toxin-antitoxin system